mmetsp:Transcript_10651/g.22902  ORF Transcript_10651/g.22902 Transcript_10651/m.22902 type:complete len:369 (-) Transcript_10651:299-1405(-)
MSKSVLLNSPDSHFILVLSKFLFLKTEAYQSFTQFVDRFGLKQVHPESVTNFEFSDEISVRSENTNESSPPSVLSSEDSSDSTHGQQGLHGLVISVPSPSHGYYIKQAAKYGLSIFVEKPVAMHPVQIKELYQVCSSYNVPLCCGFQRRFDNSYLAAMEALQAGEIGKPLSAQIFFGDSPCPPLQFLLAGGNIFNDLCIHDADFIRWALQDEVESVFATATCSSSVLAQYEIQDNATMVLTFSKGTLVTINLSRWSCYGYDQRCDIFGDSGMLAVGNESENSTVLYNQKGEHHSRLKNSYAQRFKNAFANEMDAFCDTIMKDTPWSVTEDDAIAVQSIAEAAKLSFETKSIVRLTGVARSVVETKKEK